MAPACFVIMCQTACQVSACSELAGQVYKSMEVVTLENQSFKDVEASGAVVYFVLEKLVFVVWDCVQVEVEEVCGAEDCKHCEFKRIVLKNSYIIDLVYMPCI